MAISNVISKLAEKVVNDLFTEYPQMFLSVSQAAYVNALQQALNDIVSTDIQLSRVSPDYESIMLRLMQNLSGNPEWSELITAKTGHAIVRTIASGIAYEQFSIERAYQEAFLLSASSTTGIYSGIKNLGLRPQRRQPARVRVQLNRQTANDNYTIPAYNVFSIGDMKFFNREAIIFNTNVFSVTKMLFQGVIQYESIFSDGEPFQKYVVGDNEFNASDIDVVVTVDNEVWTRKIDGLHLLGREEKGYNEDTSITGDIELAFGSSEYGKIPPLSSEIKVMWVKTLGREGNVASTGLAVKWDGNLPQFTITGTTLTNIENGEERITPDIYKKIGPGLYAANRRAVRRSDYKSQALLFPGVRDALFRGQAEIAPNRRSMMNVIVYTLLTDDNWTSANHENFINYFRENLSIYQCEFLREDPVPVVRDVVATIYCSPDSDLEDIKTQLIENIEKLFAPRPSYLGRSMFLTDITDVLNGRNVDNPNEKLEKQIEYVISGPSMSDTVITNKRQWVKLGNVDLTMLYTTRSGYSGRLDLAPNQANTTVVT